MIGVKNFIKLFKKDFDVEKKSKKKAKETGKTQEEVLQEWEQSKDVGIKLHKEYQDSFEGMDNVESFHITFKNDKERQKVLDNLPEIDTPLENGKIYIERPIFSRRQGLWGFPDYVSVINNTISIEDVKTWKVIYRTPPAIKVGVQWVKPMYFEPISHLGDSNYMEAVLQLSLYMYLLWESNRSLKVGKLYIRHLKANQVGENIGSELIEVPYLREEVQTLLKYKKLNKL